MAPSHGRVYVFSEAPEFYTSGFSGNLPDPLIIEAGIGILDPLDPFQSTFRIECAERIAPS